MWIVKNLLKGTLVLEDLSVKIAAGDYYDLDAMDRDKAHGSQSLRVAFQEGYLQNIKKEGADASAPVMPGLTTTVGVSAPIRSDQASVTKQLDELRDLIAQQKQAMLLQSAGAGTSAATPTTPAAAGGGGVNLSGLGAEIKEALTEANKGLLDGIKGQMEALARQRAAVVAEKQEVMQSVGEMDESEVRARLAILDSKEKELTTNFAELDKQLGHQADGDGSANAMADLLDDI